MTLLQSTSFPIPHPGSKGYAPALNLFWKFVHLSLFLTLNNKTDTPVKRKVLFQFFLHQGWNFSEKSLGFLDYLVCELELSACSGLHEDAFLHVLLNFSLDCDSRDLQGLIIFFWVANYGLYFHVLLLELVRGGCFGLPASVSLGRNAGYFDRYLKLRVGGE